MMSEEEKKAIENLTNKVKIWKKQRPEYGNSDIVYEIDDENKSIQTLLNLIEKQQKEIEELKNNELDYTTIYISGKFDGEKKYKDKIRAKIKELEQEKENYFEKQVIQGRIDLLNELLEEG